MNPTVRKSGTAPHMARSLTVPLTARSPMLPPGKNSGRTTYVSVENASRAPPGRTTARRRRAGRRPRRRLKAGRKRCSISSADSRPPPPWPMHDARGGRAAAPGRHPRGRGQSVIAAPLSVTRRQALEPPERGSRPRRRPRWTPSSRRAGCAGCTRAERRALVRLDAAPAAPRRCGTPATPALVMSPTSKRCSASKSRHIGRRSRQPDCRDHADAAPGPVGHVEDVGEHALRRRGCPAALTARG